MKEKKFGGKEVLSVHPICEILATKTSVPHMLLLAMFLSLRNVDASESVKKKE
jgi:hypothetical protein